MQVTIITKVNAQIIHGPDNVPAGTYYVDGISPYIVYHWTVIGASSTSVKSPNVAQGAIDEKMFITWDLNAQEHKITVEEEPLFGGYTYNLNPIPNNNVSQIPDDANINAAILDVQTNGPNGRGTVRLGPGTFYVNSILIPEGIRLEGDLTTPTILKRPDIIANDPDYNNIKMLNTYESPGGGNLYFSFVPSTYMNSKPIEIRHLTLDGNKTVPDMVPNPNYPNPNNPNEPQNIPNPENEANKFENSALIFLHAPYIKTGSLVINGVSFPSGYNAQAIGASGKVKVFINNCHFKNSGGDAVCQEGNVDLTMSNCDSRDIYRGTHTETGGADKARLTNITSLPASANVRTKAIDYETGLGGIGYDASESFRFWIDGCNFDRNVQFDHKGSKLLLTNTHVQNPPTIFIGHTGGDLVTNGCTLSFSPGFGEVPNYLFAPSHAKFNYTTFKIFGGPTVSVTPGCSTFNGLYFKNQVVVDMGNPPVGDPNDMVSVFYNSAHIGFNNCTFVDAMNDPNNPLNPNFNYNNQVASIIGPKHGLYLFNNNTNNNIPPSSQNNKDIVKMYFSGNTTVGNSFSSQDVPILHNGSCPTNFTTDFEPDVINNFEYTGGESEDEMKTHFGIRKIVPGPNDNNCDPTFTLNNPNADIWFNPKASEMLAVYGSQPWPGPGKQLYINGTFDIDANLTLDDCHLWFTPDGNVLLNDDHDLLIQGGSTLEAACFWWHGIEVPNSDNLISITGGSTIKNALHGVQVYDNAVIQVDDANFVDNGEHSISLMNMSANQYAGYIRKSNFTTQQNLLGGQFDRSVVGIRLRGVKEINIGDFNDPNSGNTFEGMHTGIRYGHWTNNNAIPISHIGIYNNSFTNIHADGNDEYAKMVNCYTDADGAAIYCKADANPNNTCHLDVRNTINNINSPSFSACDKAIVSVGNSLEAIHLNIYNNLLGIMCNSLYNRNFNIANNSINNVHMGIQISGNQRNVFVTDNTVTAFKTIFDANNNEPNITTYAPVGINFQMQTSWIGANIYQFVKDNSITINRIAGIGILNSNVGKELEESGNLVLFNTNSIAPPDNYNIQTLLGYFNVNNYKANYSRNTTIGPGGNAQVWQARTSISMLMNESRMCKLDCNRLRFTRFGFFVWGNNTTTETSITHNKCNANAIPWFFLDAATQGTFGKVGNATDPDNGNEFISTVNPIDWRAEIPAINTQFKVFRLSSGPFPEKITTDLNLLDVSESGPANLSAYGVGLNGIGFYDPCTDENEYEPEYFTEPDVDSNEYNSAMAVAQDSMAYINFPTVGSWIDRYKLFMELDTDSLLLNSSPELLYFYNTTSTQTIGDIKYAAEKIALLYDSTTNISNDSLRYASAVAANTLISSANDWEMNEKKVNDVLLFMYNNPIDSIPLYMKEDMQYLAASCPFVEGTSVYRARTIYSLWEPNAIFDDRIICIQGQNKNQDNANINIDSLIESQITEANTKAVGGNLNINSKSISIPKRIDVNAIAVYPNPTSSVVIISYNSEVDGYFKLYNSFGEVVLTTILSKDITKTQLQIKDVANGLYHYEVEFPNLRKAIGKLTIIK